MVEERLVHLGNVVFSVEDLNDPKIEEAGDASVVWEAPRTTESSSSLRAGKVRKVLSFILAALVSIVRRCLS